VSIFGDGGLIFVCKGGGDVTAGYKLSLTLQLRRVRRIGINDVENKMGGMK
jgi:hypothetical protein